MVRKLLGLLMVVAATGAGCSRSADPLPQAELSDLPSTPASNGGRGGSFLGAEGSRSEASRVSTWQQRTAGGTTSAIFDVQSAEGSEIGSFSLCTPYDVCSGGDTDLADLECREDRYGEIECRVTSPSGIDYQMKRFTSEITADEATAGATLWETLTEDE